MASKRFKQLPKETKLLPATIRSKGRGDQKVKEGKCRFNSTKRFPQPRSSNLKSRFSQHPKGARGF